MCLALCRVTLMGVGCIIFFELERQKQLFSLSTAVAGVERLIWGVDGVLRERDGHRLCVTFWT